MVDWWWGVVGTIVPALVVRQVVKTNRRREEENLRSRDNKGSTDQFVCERVCTSKKMLNRVGAFSKDPTPDTCVTVCGVSEVDACGEACALSVCANAHHVPNWNDICMRRCQTQCLKASIQLFLLQCYCFQLSIFCPPDMSMLQFLVWELYMEMRQLKCMFAILWLIRHTLTPSSQSCSQAYGVNNSLNAFFLVQAWANCLHPEDLLVC